MPRDGQRKFYFMKGDGKLESQSPCNTYIQCNLKPKTPNLSNLTEYQKVQPFVIKLFKKTREMLEKGAIKEESYCKEQFVTHLCLVSKNNGGERPGINEVSSRLMMYLNIFIPSKHFKMERLHLLKKTLRKSDYLCKFNLKEAYVCVPIEKTVDDIFTFQVGQLPVRIPLSVFWTWSSPKVVYKTNESASLHPLQIVIKNSSIPRCFSDTRENFGRKILSRDTVTYLVQDLGFVKNLKKSVLHPTQGIEFLGMITDLVEMTVYLSQKVELISKMCQDILSME